jgi:hypothetical protein
MANSHDLDGCRAPVRKHFSTETMAQIELKKVADPQSLSGALFRLPQEALRKNGLWLAGTAPKSTRDDRTAKLSQTADSASCRRCGAAQFCPLRWAQPVVCFSMKLNSSYITIAIAPTTSKPLKARPICMELPAEISR